MSNNRKLFIDLLKKKILIIFLMILSVIISLFYIVSLNDRNNSDQSVLINVLGKQRMLTQMIAKDCNMKYAALQALQNGTMLNTEESLRSKMVNLNQSMEEAHNEFDHTLAALNSGVLKVDDQEIEFKRSLRHIGGLIHETNAQWDQFHQSVQTLKDSTVLSKQAAEAIQYVNTNDISLLNNCDKIIQSLIADRSHASSRDMLLSIGLFLLSVIALFFSIYQLEKYIILPLNELYKGISDMKLIKSNLDIATPTKNDLKPVLSEIQDSFGKLNNLISLIKNINQNNSFQEVLEYIYKSFSAFVPYSHIGIALLRDDGKSLEACFGISDESLTELPKNLLGLKVKLSDTSLGRIIETGKPRVINDFDKYLKHKPERSYNDIILGAGIKASITLPLTINKNPVGIIFFSSKIKNIYHEAHVHFLEALADSIAISLNQNIYIDELLYSSVLALAKMAESRDEETGEHLDRMKIYSERITQYLMDDKKFTGTITTEFLREIKRFSPMHDIGKVGIRDSILLKPGKLTMSEINEMKRHTVYGAEVLRAAEQNIEKLDKSVFGMGIEIAEGHHEKWDGSGYPYCREGEDIPLSARIVAVADVFDALTSKRPYKEAYSFETSFEMLEAGSGQHFDPIIIETLVKHKEDLHKIYLAFQS